MMLACRDKSLSRALYATLVIVLVAGATLSVSTVASAHAFLDDAWPEQDAVVEVLPETVTLTYTEPVEVRASIFKVYPLEEDDDPLRLRAQAAQLVDEVLQVRGDEEDRVDAGIESTARESAEIQIILQEDLPPGSYVVMWRVLSIDTHITWGHYVFTYAPAED